MNLIILLVILAFLDKKVMSNSQIFFLLSNGLPYIGNFIGDIVKHVIFKNISELVRCINIKYKKPSGFK